MTPFLGGAANPAVLCKARLGTGFSARTQKRPYTHGRIFLAGGRFEPELLSGPWSAWLCGCNGPALELRRTGWLAGAWIEGEEPRQNRKFQNVYSGRPKPTSMGAPRAAALAAHLRKEVPASVLFVSALVVPMWYL
jgi:hypothetical protein